MSSHQCGIHVVIAMLTITWTLWQCRSSRAHAYEYQCIAHKLNLMCVLKSYTELLLYVTWSALLIAFNWLWDSEMNQDLGHGSEREVDVCKHCHAETVDIFSSRFEWPITQCCTHSTLRSIRLLCLMLKLFFLRLIYCIGKLCARTVTERWEKLCFNGRENGVSENYY